MTSAVTSLAPIDCVIRGELDIAEARRRARAAAETLGFPTVRVYRLMTAVSELAYNLHIHAIRGGVVRIRSIERGGRIGLEVVAEDDGPGIADVALAMRDGFSTAGGLGSGLPGTKRLMDEFAIRSEPGRGTCVTTVIWDR